MFNSPSKTLETHFPLDSIGNHVGKCEVSDSCVSQCPHFEGCIVPRIGPAGETGQLTLLETCNRKVLEVPRTCPGQTTHVCLEPMRVIIPGEGSLGPSSQSSPPTTEPISLAG